MRFVFVSTMSGYPWGGSEELWSQTALRLRMQGHSVAASVPWWPGLSPKVLALKKQGVKLFVRKLPQHHALPIRAWHRIKSKMGLEDNSFKWLRRQEPGLVVVSQGANLDILEWAKCLSEGNLPFVSIVQCNGEVWWPQDDTVGMMATAYRSARRIYCVSNHNLELLERQVSESLPNASVVWNPFNVPTDPPPAWPADRGVWKLAFVARLDTAAKGQDLLLQVLSHPRWQRRPLEVNLHGTGPCEQGLKKLANYLQLKNVRFHGHTADVRKIWEDNHLLVLPSRYEGLPLALVEAMWCGRPAVVTDVGGNAEMCVDGETGFVAAAPAVKMLDETLERAWNHRDDWRRMGEAARARAEQIIPKDPVGAFCQQLLECAEMQNTKSEGDFGL